VGLGLENKIVISCFDKSTNMVKPWVDAGYLCYCVDLQHPKTHQDRNIIKVKADMLDWMPPRADIAFAAFFPPCTDVAISGARWFKDKGIGALINALRLFEVSIKIAEWSGAPYIIENPVSTISTYWRKPDYMFDPCDYGDPYTKKTCLWTGNGFVMPPKNRVAPEIVCSQGSWIQKLGGKSQRTKDLRSATPMGFAKAVFEFNQGAKQVIQGTNNGQNRPTLKNTQMQPVDMFKKIDKDRHGNIVI